MEAKKPFGSLKPITALIGAIAALLVAITGLATIFKPDEKSKSVTQTMTNSPGGKQAGGSIQ